MLPNVCRLRRRGERGFTLIELLVVIVSKGSQLVIIDEKANATRTC